MIRAKLTPFFLLICLIMIGCETTSYRGRGTLDLSDSKTVYIESFDADKYDFSSYVIKRIAEIGLKPVNKKENAGLVLNWRYSIKRTNVRFSFEEKSGAIAYLGLCEDPVETGRDATWLCIERALVGAGQ